MPFIADYVYIIRDCHVFCTNTGVVLILVLKPLDNFGTVKDQSSHLLYLDVCIKKQTCENLNSIGCRSCEIIREEKKHPCPRSCVLSDLDFGPQNLILRSRNQIQIF